MEEKSKDEQPVENRLRDKLQVLKILDCDQFVTDGQFQNFKSLKACKR